MCAFFFSQFKVIIVLTGGSKGTVDKVPLGVDCGVVHGVEVSVFNSLVIM